MPSNLLQPFLDQQGFVMLDGGLATELEKYGADLKHELWSAKILIEAPEMIRQVSEDYLVAGADLISTASYQASFEGFRKAGFERDRARNLMQLSVDLALLAREKFLSSRESHHSRLRPLVGASIGPYGACLADGGEYHGNYDLDKQGLIDFHRPRMTELAHSDADLFLLETIPSGEEAEALIELLAEFPKMAAIISFSCRNETEVSHGEAFADCAALCESADQIIAIGINCTAPHYILPLLNSAQGIKKPLAVYPNSGEQWLSSEYRWVGDPDEGMDARAWYEAGARLIGGCCRTSPGDIGRMRAEILDHLVQSSA